MGILDDAIREHLELKRRRGADPAEISRLENEALGPVRREPFAPADEESASSAELEDRAAHEGSSKVSEAEYEEYYDEEAGDDWGASFDEDLERPRGSRSRAAAPPADEEEEETESPPERGPRLWRRSRRRSIPPENAPPTQGDAPADPEEAEETAEYDVDDALDSRGRKRRRADIDRPVSDEEGDMLEETPEFLQDDPEHDRLWFEQRPPRDFDFDD